MNVIKPVCEICGRVLVPDEVGASKLCLGKTTEIYYCLPCLAEHCQTTEAFLKEKITFLRERGCVLFP